MIRKCKQLSYLLPCLAPLMCCMCGGCCHPGNSTSAPCANLHMSQEYCPQTTVIEPQAHVLCSKNFELAQRDIVAVTCNKLMPSRQQCFDCDLCGIAKSALQATQALRGMPAALAHSMPG